MFIEDLSRLVPQTLTAQFSALTGLVAGTLVETAEGWQPVQDLAIGQSVQTLDGGLARILGLDRRQLSLHPGTPLIHIAGGHLDATSDMTLLPGQHLLIDTLDDADLGGAPFAMVEARALAGLPGITRISAPDRVEVITPLFADEEAVWANSGVLMHCPGILQGAGRYPEDSFFPMLDLPRARAFMAQRHVRFGAVA